MFYIPTVNESLIVGNRPRSFIYTGSNLILGDHLFSLIRKRLIFTQIRVLPPIVWRVRQATGQSNLSVHIQINDGLYMDWNITLSVKRKKSPMLAVKWMDF